MTQKNINNQALPTAGTPGMTIREYVATAAMQGILASAFSREGRSSPTAPDVARHAVEYADALVKELKRATPV
jgi:hypothetical protein